MLSIGAKAPDFLLPDQNGTVHSLSEYAGKKILLYFYAKDNTPGCSKQAVAYSEKINEFAAKNVIVIGVSKDSVTAHKKFEANYELKFTILSDTERTAIESYDVWKEKKLYGKISMGVIRTTYIIDENGMIIFANDKVKAADDAEKMLDWLKIN